MEAAIFAIVFLLALVGYFVLAARAGFAEDALWSRQQTLAIHGVRLGLPAGERAAGRPDLFAPPSAAERLAASLTPVNPNREARVAEANDPGGPKVLVPDWSA